MACVGSRAGSRTVLRLVEPGAVGLLTDGVPRPDWKRGYPSVVGKLFARGMAEDRDWRQKALKEHGVKRTKVKTREWTGTMTELC